MGAAELGSNSGLYGRGTRDFPWVPIPSGAAGLVAGACGPLVFPVGVGGRDGREELMTKIIPPAVRAMIEAEPK